MAENIKTKTEIEKEIDKLLDRERWQAQVTGEVNGALAVLNLLSIGENEKIRLLSEAIGLSEETAAKFIRNK